MKGQKWEITQEGPQNHRPEIGGLLGGRPRELQFWGKGPRTMRGPGAGQETGRDWGVRDEKSMDAGRTGEQQSAVFAKSKL